ncbi:transcription regulatory protein SNF2 isoform X2 [Wolffia australiana]
MNLQHANSLSREESNSGVQDLEKQKSYLQFVHAAQQKSLQNIQAQHLAKAGMPVPGAREQEMRSYNMKMQELLSLQAMSRKQNEHYPQVEQGHGSNEQVKSSQSSSGIFGGSGMNRPAQNASNQIALGPLQAMQAWAMERNIDLSLSANANLFAQLLPLFQAKMLEAQKGNENNSPASQSHASSAKPQVSSSSVASENMGHGFPSKGPQFPPPTAANGGGVLIQQQQQLSSPPRETEKSVSHQMGSGSATPPMHPPQSSGSISQNIESPSAKSVFLGTEARQMLYLRQLQQLNRPAQPVTSSVEGIPVQHPSQGSSAQAPQQRVGFTKQQLHVLKAQILAFRRLKRGERSLPQEVLQAIVPPPLERQATVPFPPQAALERIPDKRADEKVRHVDTDEKISAAAVLSKGEVRAKEESFVGDERGSVIHGLPSLTTHGRTEQSTISLVKTDHDAERQGRNIPANGDVNVDKGKVVTSQNITMDEEQPKKAGMTISSTSKESNPTRRFTGPLFDFPFFTRKLDSFSTSTSSNSPSHLVLSYDVKDLLYEEGVVVLGKKRSENLKKISGLLSLSLETRKLRPDLVLRLQIEERKLRLIDLQARLRHEVDQQQQEIMGMPDRPYRKFVRQCERQRAELLRQVQVSQKLMREKQLKSIFHWRKKLLESHWAIRDARTTRNRGVAKYHERMLREFAKKKDDDRTRRMEALKNNDVDRYREMLLEQQTNVPGDAAQRYAVLSSFLSQTEEYLHKLGGKITAAKNHQEVEEAANVAAAAARSQGLSEEEVRAAAACAGEEVMIRNRFSEMNAPKDNSVSKYYSLAHAVNERVFRQPSNLRAGTLRDYQLVGLQWMLSLYNNKLNGILADEMGLGKTVQVMALIAYLMEFKGNNGPHLIIVPNAVLVNWKSELYHWLPSVCCIFYVGGKDERSKLFSQEVCARKFNVLVTTYEFVMYDRSKLSKIDWKYIIIDEAQRMKDRESVLARDLDRYRCQRRLLLTGTPLQNDLKELWSLLNLLLPEVFDNRKAFHDWFSKPFQRDSSSHSPEEDDWLETEKKVIIIHRLHQILEPFMLRRRVEDVEGSLPPKVSIVLKCRMSAMQGAIYDWIKSTGTIRVDPEDELRRVEKNPLYQIKMYKNLNNKCMELRKACNHPLLNYPYLTTYSTDFLVRSCGKLWVLDRILIKLQRAGHRVLLFSTMTKLLDIMEEYLQWRGLIYRRIDGTTSLEDRESAIVDFNRPNSDCFIFLLSIRAAGRGLNLQTADTVVIYDPDPNPQNEEQAVARAHRIGQKREVKVIYMEAVVDKISSYEKEDELRNGGAVDSEDDLAGRDRYVGSIESLIRNNIQQYKIDMADEVINAGRFDQRTTHEERRLTLETLLHDEERYQENVHDVPSLQEVNRMIARSKEEVELFDQMDEEFDWTGEMMTYEQVPKWLRVGSKEVNAVVSTLSRKPSKSIIPDRVAVEAGQMTVGLSIGRPERRRNRPNYSIYGDLEEEDAEDSDDEYLTNEEEGEIREFDEDESNRPASERVSGKDRSEEEPPTDGGSIASPPCTVEVNRTDPCLEDACSSGYSSGSQRLPVMTAPPGFSSQKFASLSALDTKPAPVVKKSSVEDLEEGEIAMSSDSHMDLHQSGSCAVERDEGEEEQVLQPRIKRKRSMRVRPRPVMEKLESEKSDLKPQIFQPDLAESVSETPELSSPSVKQKRSAASRKGPNSQRANNPPKVINSPTGPTETTRESWNGKASVTHKSDSMQRKLKNVIGELQRRIDRDGQQIVPIVFDSWRRNESLYYASSASTASNILDLRRIDRRVDAFEYKTISDFVADVQLMFQNLVQYLGYSYEVKNEARKLQDLFLEIMKTAFPDADLSSPRPAPAFLGPLLSPSSRSTTVTAAASSMNHCKQPKPPPEDLQPSPRASGKAHGKESRPASSVAVGRGGGDMAAPNCPPFLAHPGDLVIHKKKRKDREKSASLMHKNSPAAMAAAAAAAASLLGPRPPPRPVAVPSVGGQRLVKLPPPACGGGVAAAAAAQEAQWAKPVKKLRTDTGKRRPSHL